MKKLILFVTLFTVYRLQAQDAIEYKKPPTSIADLVMAKPTPSVSFDRKGEWMLIMERSNMPTVEELAQPELRIAGLRINPNNFGFSRTAYMISLILKNIKTGTETSITGLPANLKAGNVQWSTDENKIAFTQSSNNSIDLFVIDVKSGKANRVNKLPLNLVGGGFEWFDNNTLIYQAIVKPYTMAPGKPLAPKGPVVQQNLGKVADSVTYQDLIKSPADEVLYEFYATAQLVKNTNGVETKIGSPAIYNSISVSPDKRYLLVNRIDKPYSYLVPAGGFNATVYITDMNGKQIKEITKLPSSELAPRGFDNVLNAPRAHQWLVNQPATITWIEPLDSGLIKKNVDFHDAVFALTSPFSGSAKQLVKTGMRMASLNDINDSIYLVTEYSQAKHRTKTSKLNPASGNMEVIIDRSTDDAYIDPGTPVTDRNKYGKYGVRLINGTKMLMRSVGSTPKGDMPFLASFDLATKQQNILWRCTDPYYESVTTVLDFEKLLIIGLSLA